MAESEEELKSLLMSVKEESQKKRKEKTGLKLHIKKQKEEEEGKKKTLRSGHLVPSLHSKQKGKRWKQWQISPSWAQKLLKMVTAAMKLADNCFWEGKLWQT